MYLVHYGSNRFFPDKVRPVKNRPYMNKPFGGLWTSPINTNFGWKQWCEAANFRQGAPFKSFFVLKLHPYALVLKINSLTALKILPIKYKKDDPFLKTVIDFEELAKTYDAIWLTLPGEQRTRSTTPNLYGWDCESVLIINPKFCEQAYGCIGKNRG